MVYNLFYILILRKFCHVFLTPMHALLEIAECVINNLVTVEDIFADAKGKFFKQQRSLLEGMLSHSFQSDKEAAKFLFDAETNDNRYKQTKMLLKKRLLRWLTQLPEENPGNSDFYNAHYFCITHLAYGAILRLNGAVHAALSMYQDVFTVAQKYHLTEMALQAAVQLERDYNNIREYKKSDEYGAKAQKMQEISKDESQALQLVSRFDSITKKKSVRNEDDKEELRTLAKEIGLLAEKHTTRTLLLYSCRTLMTVNIMDDEYDNAIHVCDTLEQFFRTYPHLYTRDRMSVLLSLATDCHIVLRRYDEARSTVQRYINTSSPGMYNWFANHLQLASIDLQTGEYDSLAVTLTMMYEYEPRMNTIVRENAYLHLGYLVYIYKTGKFYLPPSIINPLVERFDLNEFLNTTAFAAKDKTSGNLSRIILHSLLLLAENNVDAFCSRADALRQYRISHLKGNKNVRGQIFLRLLCALMDYYLDVSKVSTKHKDKIEALKDYSTVKMETMETIPYDKLWEILVDHIQLLKAKQTK